MRRFLLLLVLLSACARPAREEITFLVAADTHFGYDGMEERNARQIEAMRTLPGTPYPPEIGGVVGTPRFLLVCGDLTEAGEGDTFRRFIEAYDSLPFPVYLASGNHDRAPKILRPVLSSIKDRHGGLAYSFDEGSLHVAGLDVYPDRRNLEWLRQDLARIPSTRPIVLFFHYSLAGPYSDWWKESEKAAFRREVGDRRVAGVFHGHWHGSEHYEWRGLDVYDVGSPKHSDHSFGVARLEGRVFSVASFDWDRREFTWRHRKRI